MSRTKPEEKSMTNPCKIFLQWDSENIQWKYWDKSTEQEISIPFDISFIVLDCLSTVTGFDEKAKSRIWSNEVRRVSSPVKVNNKNGTIAVGPWSNIKGQVPFAKFAASVYAMAKLGENYELVNFKLSGCSLGPWFDFLAENGGEHTLYGDVVVKVASTEEGKKGRVEFNSPVYSIVSRKLSEEARNKANDLDTELQTYLDQYFEAKKTENPEEAEEVRQDAPQDEYVDQSNFGDDDVPF